jgi:hypothetical protein
MLRGFMQNHAGAKNLCKKTRERVPEFLICSSKSFQQHFILGLVTMGEPNPSILTIFCHF